MKSCFFIGHRDTPEKLLYALEQTVERHITEYGVTEFYVGQHGRFDALAVQAVANAKQRHPAVTLTLLLACHPAEQTVAVPEYFDDIFYPPGMESVPRRFAIDRANRYMIAHCDCLIAYAWQPGGSAVKFLQFAQRQPHLAVTTLARP